MPANATLPVEHLDGEARAYIAREVLADVLQRASNALGNAIRLTWWWVVSLRASGQRTAKGMVHREGPGLRPTRWPGGVRGGRRLRVPCAALPDDRQPRRAQGMTQYQQIFGRRHVCVFAPFHPRAGNNYICDWPLSHR